jgi:hypothetical protein
VSGSQDEENPLDAARQLLIQELDRVREDKKTYPELAEREKRVSTALGALEGGGPLKKRVAWEAIAVYVEANPGSKPGEIAADLEIPVKNVYPHLDRNRDTVFDKHEDGSVDVRDGWEKYRRDTGSS